MRRLMPILMNTFYFNLNSKKFELLILFEIKDSFKDQVELDWKDSFNKINQFKISEIMWIYFTRIETLKLEMELGFF